jgi:hypothetical protein
MRRRRSDRPSTSSIGERLRPLLTSPSVRIIYHLEQGTTVSTSTSALRPEHQTGGVRCLSLFQSRSLDILPFLLQFEFQRIDSSCLKHHENHNHTTASETRRIGEFTGSTQHLIHQMLCCQFLLKLEASRQDSLVA